MSGAAAWGEASPSVDESADCEAAFDEAGLFGGRYAVEEPAPLPPVVPPPLGNGAARERLCQQLDADRLHPCLLFVGPQGLGKRQLARWLAMRRNCDEPGAPCGGCWSCRQIQAGQHPDIIELEPDPEKAVPIISVAQARALSAQLSLHRAHARTRFVIIDEADRLTVEAANALLLTLEEPPDGTIFILVSARPAALLSTVRSRCLRVRLGPVPNGELEAWLAARELPEAAWLAAMAEGCPGRALSLAQGGAERWREVRDLFIGEVATEIWRFFALAERLGKAEKADKARLASDQALALDALERLLQDVLAHHAGRPLRYNADRAALVAAWAGALHAEGVAALATELDKSRQMLAEHVNGRLVFDALIVRIAAELGPARRAGAPFAAPAG